jgi:hypothetical protein
LPTVSDPSAAAQVRVNGGAYEPVASGSASAALSLNVGVNTVDVEVAGVQARTAGNTHTITVIRAAAPAKLEFKASTYNVVEETGRIDVKVVRSGNTGNEASVKYESFAGTASAIKDFTPVSGVLKFAPGETVKTIRLSIPDDTLIEYKETFSVRLSSPSSGASLGALASTEVYIFDQDHLR